MADSMYRKNQDSFIMSCIKHLLLPFMQAVEASTQAPPGFGGRQPSFRGQQAYEDLPLKNADSDHLKGLFSQAAIRHQYQGKPAATQSPSFPVHSSQACSGRDIDQHIAVYYRHNFFCWSRGYLASAGDFSLP